MRWGSDIIWRNGKHCVRKVLCLIFFHQSSEDHISDTQLKHEINPQNHHKQIPVFHKPQLSKHTDCHHQDADAANPNTIGIASCPIPDFFLQLIMKLDPLVRKYIRNFDLTERQARALLHIRDRKTQIDAVQEICENGLNESDTAQFVTEILKTGHSPSMHMNRMKDVKLLRNTITNAVNLIRESGVEAEFTETSHDWGDEFTITVKN